jgi:hypothetical protein
MLGASDNVVVRAGETKVIENILNSSTGKTALDVKM